LTTTRFKPFIPAVTNDKAAVAKLDFSEAQQYCNFVLFEPMVLPNGYSIVEHSLRPQSADTSASYHCVIKGADAEFSIKQFNFNDIETIAAYDHPNLWKCDDVVADRAKFADKFKISAHIFGGNNASIAENIIWIGYNYKADPQKSLTTQIMRTNIEMTVRKGNISDDILLTVCRGLKVVNPTLAERINHTSFAELSWKHRFSTKTGNVPISYWKYQRPEEFTTQMYAKNEIPANKLCAQTCPLQIGDYTLDSAVEFSKDEQTQEMEYIYQHNTTLGSYIRLLVSPLSGSIVIPPEAGNQHYHSEQFKHNNTSIYLTYLTEQYGMYGAAWTTGKANLMLFAKPATWTNKLWFKSLSSLMVDYSHRMHQSAGLQRHINPWPTHHYGTTILKTSAVILAAGVGLYAGYKYLQSAPTESVKPTFIHRK
jgi:hypothetical protein